MEHLSEKDNARQGFFSEAELTLVIAHLPEELQDFVRFAAACGMRKGEIAGLPWKMVEGDELRIPANICKNRKGRILPLTGELAEIIERRHAAVPSEKNGTVQLCEYIFHRDRSPVAELRKSWQSAAIAAGLGIIDPMTIRTFLLFIYGTGARVYEAINLRVSDINFASKLVSLRDPQGGRRRVLPIGRTLRNTLDLYVQSTAKQRGEADSVFVTVKGRKLRFATMRYNFVRICGRARIHQEHSYSPTPGLHDLRHTFAVHVLETWVREGKDLRQKLPLLSGYMGHSLLKSTELYLRLVPDRFVKPLARLQEPPIAGSSHERA
jgi:integrase